MSSNETPRSSWYNGHSRPITRRRLLTQVTPQTAVRIAAIVAGTAVATAGAAYAVEALRKQMETPYGKFLAFHEGKLALSDKPQPTQIRLTPAKQKFSEAYLNGGNIPFRRAPQEGPDDSVDVNPATITRQLYAIRVLGGMFTGVNPLGESWGQLAVTFNGRQFNAGEWFALTDESGTHYVDLQGTAINTVDTNAQGYDATRQPLYVAGNFVTPIEKAS